MSGNRELVEHLLSVGGQENGPDKVSFFFFFRVLPKFFGSNDSNELTIPKIKTN